MTHRYINKGQNRSRLFVRERVELFIELSWEVIENKLWHIVNIANYIDQIHSLLSFKVWSVLNKYVYFI